VKRRALRTRISKVGGIKRNCERKVKRQRWKRKCLAPNDIWLGGGGGGGEKGKRGGKKKKEKHPGKKGMTKPKSDNKKTSMPGTTPQSINCEKTKEKSTSVGGKKEMGATEGGAWIQKVKQTSKQETPYGRGGRAYQCMAKELVEKGPGEKNVFLNG